MTSSSAPRMVNSYKRTSSPRSPTNSGEIFTPAHEENVRFIHDKQGATVPAGIPALSAPAPADYLDQVCSVNDKLEKPTDTLDQGWQCVLRDIRSTQNSERNDRGPQEYVEKNPNPNLHSFTPVDLSDLKKRNTLDSKKS